MAHRAVNIGLIGTGFMGDAHSYSYTAQPIYTDGELRANLVAVASRTMDRAKHFQQKYGYQKAYDDWREMLKDPDIEAVSICTPNGLHYEQAKEAIANGKHVYVDKPLCCTVEQAEELARLAEEKGVLGMTVFNSRFTVPMMKMKQLMEEDYTGPLTEVRICMLHAGLVTKERKVSWRLDPALTGNGVLFDLGSHMLDCLTNLVGPIDEIFCETETHHKVRDMVEGGEMRIETDDAAYMIARLASGAKAFLEVSKLSTGGDGTTRIEICGEKGAVRHFSERPELVEVFDNTEGTDPLGGGTSGWKYIDCYGKFLPPAGVFPATRGGTGNLAGHVMSVMHFLQAIHGERKIEPDLWQGAYVQKVMAAAYTSAEKGCWVKV
ncbi:Gfo/Idh/MocA family oxidoreductase [Eubacteriales bacterium OttesenSCG-928-M02]|nr:Gfo/Idh/MocA family oxidoreductase [Eubacteriales bacterium OttesenSCG-928-M02]